MTLAATSSSAEPKHDVPWRRLVWVPLLVFAGARVVDAVLLLWLGHHTTDSRFGLHDYSELVTSADGEWYRQIAEHGYPRVLPRDGAGVVQSNAWVFFPLYPVLVSVPLLLGLPFAVAASLVSLAGAAAGTVLVFELVRRHGGTWVAVTVATALNFFPAAVAFQMAYTEGLALLLVAGTLLALDRGRYGWAVAGLLLLGLTRPMVIAFAPVLAIAFLLRWRARRTTPFARRERWWLAALGVTSVLSFAIWPVVAGVVTGERDAYTQSQHNWLAPPDAPWASWWRVGFVDGRTAIAVVVVLAVVAAAVALGRRGAAAWGVTTRLWAGSYFLYLLVTTRTTSSIFRYAMLALVPWWPLPEAGRDASPAAKGVILGGIVAIGTALKVAWILWVVIAVPGSTDYP